MDDVFSKPRDFIDETRDPLEPRKPFPVAWLNVHDDLVPYEDYPEDDVTLGVIDLFKTPPPSRRQYYQA